MFQVEKPAIPKSFTQQPSVLRLLLTMTAKEKLIQEINQAPDFLIEEVLDFILFVKDRRKKEENQPTLKEPRPFGLCAGEFTVPDDFNEPLPEDILSSFEPD